MYNKRFLVQQLDFKCEHFASTQVRLEVILNNKDSSVIFIWSLLIIHKSKQQTAHVTLLKIVKIAAKVIFNFLKYIWRASDIFVMICCNFIWLIRYSSNTRIKTARTFQTCSLKENCLAKWAELRLWRELTRELGLKQLEPLQSRGYSKKFIWRHEMLTLDLLHSKEGHLLNPYKLRWIFQ